MQAWQQSKASLCHARSQPLRSQITKSSKKVHIFKNQYVLTSSLPYFLTMADDRVFCDHCQMFASRMARRRWKLSQKTSVEGEFSDKDN